MDDLSILGFKKELYRDWNPDCRDEEAISFFISSEKKYTRSCSNAGNVWISKKLLGQEFNPQFREDVGFFVMESLCYRDLTNAVYRFEKSIQEIQNQWKEIGKDLKVSLYSSILYHQSDIVFDEPIISMECLNDVHIHDEPDPKENQEWIQKFRSLIEEYQKNLKIFLSHLNLSPNYCFWLSTQSKLYYGNYVNIEKIQSITTSLNIDSNKIVQLGKSIEFQLIWGMNQEKSKIR